MDNEILKPIRNMEEFHALEIERRVKWCLEHGKNCQNCEENSCPLCLDYESPTEKSIH